MAKTIPTLVAYLLSHFGMNVFAAGYSNYQLAALSPLLAGDVVKLGMYFLLLDINLYMKSFRKIHYVPQNVFEMFAAAFFIDTALMCVWYPVENYILSLAPRGLRLITNISKKGICEYVFFQIVRFTTSPRSLIGFCYVLSILFLTCVLHATRAVDFRLIRAAGLRCFIEDATRKFNKSLKKNILLLTSKCSNTACRTRTRKPRRKRQ